MTLKKLFLLVAVFILVLAPYRVDADVKGRLIVTITDADEKPIQDVKITLTNAESPTIVYEIVTDKKGKATIAGLDPVAYEAKAEREGFQTIETKAQPIKLRAGVKVKLNWVMLTMEQAKATAFENFKTENPEEYKEIQANEANNAGLDAYEKGNVDDAKKYFEEAISLKDDVSHFPHLILGNLAFNEKKLEEATKYLERARELDTEGASTVDICRLLGACYQIAQETDKAYEVWTELVEKAPDNPDANVLHNLAAIDFQRKNTDKAIEWLEICRVKHPEYVDGLDLLGSLYLQKTDYEKALAVYTEYLTALEAAPVKDDAKIADARNMVKMLAEELKR